MGVHDARKVSFMACPSAVSNMYTTSPRVILTSPKKLLMSNSSSDKVADLGESPRGPAPPALFLDQTEAQRAEKKFWRPPPHLRVWMTAPLPLI